VQQIIKPKSALIPQQKPPLSRRISDLETDATADRDAQRLQESLPRDHLH